MAETLAILKDTPIPTLMILGGIALLVLSVVSSISDKIKVAPERQKWSWIAGLVLVVIGTGLYLFAPDNGQPATTPTATATRPQASETPSDPTNTPVIATETQAAPTKTIVTSCANRPVYFEDYWVDRIGQLGCPLAAQTGGYKLTQQSFENGWMFGRPDTLLIYVLLDDRSYEIYTDTWTSENDVYSCPDIAVSQTPPTPRYGFGLLWCNSQVVRDGLGLAIADEQSLSATLQTFDHGVIFEVRKDIFLLDERQETWEQLQ